MKSFSRSLVGGLLSLPLVAGAESTRQLDSHAHGHATLNIAVDEAHLLIELESPAANIVGFEHKPETDEQHAALAKAVAVLQAGDGLFQWDAAAACTLDEADVEAGQLGDEDSHGDHDDDDHDKHADHDDDKDHDKHADHDDDKDHDKHADHDDDKDHDKHADHDDDKDHDEHGHDDAEVHSEFHVVWSFDCQSTSALQSIVVDLFDQFPGIEELDVAIVGLNSQSAAELTADNRQLSL